MKNPKISVGLAILLAAIWTGGGASVQQPSPKGKATAPPRENLPDLTIEEIYLTKDCHVAVEVKNLGPGTVPDEVWTVHTPESAAVYLYIDGKAWGGGTIYRFDPGKNLQKAGGAATYTSKLQVSGSATITAIVDHTEQVKEANEANNKKATRLTCHAKPVEAGAWKILRMASLPPCYNEDPHKDLSMTVNVLFEASGGPSGDLVIRAEYRSNIDHDITPKLNLTEAVATTCGGTAPCTLPWGDAKLSVLKVPSATRPQYEVSFNIFISPKLEGDITITFWAFTRDGKIDELTDTKTLVIRPCGAP